MALSRCKSSLGSSQNCEQNPDVAWVQSVTGSLNDFAFSQVAFHACEHAVAKGQRGSDRSILNANFGTSNNQESVLRLAFCTTHQIGSRRWDRGSGIETSPNLIQPQRRPLRSPLTAVR